MKQIYGDPYQDIPLGKLPDLPFIKDEGKRKQALKWYSIWRTKRFKRFIGRMPFFARITYGVSNTKMSESLASHINWYEELVRDKGALYAVKLLKRVRDACVRFAADQQFETIDEVKTHKDGLPLRVGHLREWLTSTNVNCRRAAIHVLDIIKLCEVSGDDPSTESITNPVTGSTEHPSDEIGGTLLSLGKTKVDQDTLNRIVREFRWTLSRMFPAKSLYRRLSELSDLSDIHMSVRKGPNGPAIGTIEEDFLGVTNSGLIEPISQIAESTNNLELQVIIEEMTEQMNDNKEFVECRGPCIDSRLAIKYEPWGKTRYFAICDWFSQSCLKGLHKWIFNWLEKQVEDGTMSQERVAEIVRSWTSSSLGESATIDNVYSLDLSKATDRLPATIQREILTQMFGKNFADRWYTICTKRNFRTPKGDFIAFRVGQPLGVYSSWAMLALTHHAICRTALRLSGRQIDKKSAAYVVIGDDVAMTGDSFAKWYSLIMSNILEVSISPIKGFTPQTRLGSNPLNATNKSTSAEIAKRIFIDGKEISVVSPETLLSAMEYPADFPNMCRQLTNRGVDQDYDTPVAPIALAGLGFNPDLACTFATFPLRPGVPESTLKAVSENYPELMSYIAWYQRQVPISIQELETMFRWSIRSGLQSTLNKFKDKFNVYIDISRKPKECGNRMYHFKVKEYIVRILINKAMLYILDLVVETDVLNFQGPGKKLDEIASALNTMLDFEAALKGKPSEKRENLHRMRSRVISKLQPFVLKSVKKAIDNFGILLIDQGEQIQFVPQELIDIHSHNYETRELLKTDRRKRRHDESFARTVDVVEKRTLEATA